MPHWPCHGKIEGAIVMIGFGSIGKGTLPLIERHFDYRQGAFRRHRPRRLRPQAARRARHQVRASGDHARELSRSARQDISRPARARASASISRSTLPRSTSCAIAARSARSISTPSSSRGRASISTSRAATSRAPTTRCARPCSPSAAPIPAASTAVSCCGANPGMVSWFVKQALVNLAEDLGDAAPEPTSARGMGQARPTARRQGRAYRRARHAARQVAQAAQRVRQHLVGRGVPFRGHAAGRTRLGHA